MADPAELIRKNIADVLRSPNWPTLLLSEKIDAILAALTPPATPTQGASAEDAAVLARFEASHAHVVRMNHMGYEISGHHQMVHKANTDAVLSRMAGKVPTCSWTYDDIDYKWDTACGNAHVFNDGGPSDNSHKFCPYCSGEIKEAAPESPR